DRRVLALEVGQQRGVVRVFALARQVRLGVDDAGGIVDEVLQPDQRDRVPAPYRGERQADGGVVVLFGGDVVDDEAQAQRRFVHSGGASGRWLGCAWYRMASSRPRQCASASGKPGALA